MARTDVPSVREEIGDVEDEDFTDGRIETFIRRAHHVVERNVPAHRRGEHLQDVEMLVAAHFAFDEQIGQADGRRVTRAAESDGELQFEGSKDSVYGEKSPYWARAVELEPALEKPGNVFETLG